MNHSINVHLGANIDNYKAGMEAAKRTGTESLGFIASIFDKIKSLFSGTWNSISSVFSGVWEKIKGGFGSMSDGVSGSFKKIAGYFPGMHKDLDATKTKMAETEDQSSSLAKKVGITLVAALVAATATIGILVKKGLDVISTFAGIATSTDIAVSQISRFDAAAARSGVGVKDLGTSMGKFHEAMAKSAAGDGNSVFDKLGVKVADSNNALLKTDDVLIEVSKKIAGMSSEAEKYAAASKLGFEGKVQALEDIAHASDLSARVTDEQAGAAVRLGKIWHEILPSGRSMWAEISDKLTNSLTPAMTTASIAVLQSKNQIVQAFEQIYGGGSMFDKLADKIKGWSQDASKWFSDVGKSATNMTISLMQYLAFKTGLGDPTALKQNGAGYVPARVKLTSDKNEPIITDAEKEARKQFEATNKSVADRIEIMKQQIKVGATLTEGQLALLKVENASLGLKPQEKTAAIEQAQALDVLEKQFKTQQEAKAAAVAASKKEGETYTALMASIHGKIDEDRLQLAVSGDLTDSQKMLIKLDADLAEGKLKLTPAHEAATRAALDELGAIEQQIKAKKQYDEIVKAVLDTGTATIASLDDQIAKQREHNAEIGKTAEQIQLAKQAQLDLDTAQVQSDADFIRDGLTKWNLDQQSLAVYRIRLGILDADIERRRTLSGLMANGADREADFKAATDAAAASKHLAEQAIQDWRDAGSNIADSLSSAFGTAGNAIGQMFKGYADGVAVQLRAQKELAEAKLKLDTDPEKLAAIQHAQQMGFQAQIKSYGDMAGAAKGFFKENTTGYKLMEGAEKAFRLVEFASQMESLYTHLFVTTAKAAATTGGQAVETAAVGAGEAERNALKVPGVFMAFMSALGPYGAAAAAVAIAAVLGGAFSGGHGGMSAADRQKAQGTGSVLGDSDAKSESLKRALDAVEKNTYQGLQISGSMLATLRSIDTNITSFASQLVRTTDITNPGVGPLNSNNGGATTGFGVAAGAAIGAYFGPIGAAIGAFVGLLAKNIPIIGKIATSIFGGKQSVQDSGFTMDSASLASILSGGVKASQYADIKTSGGWFSSDKTSSQATALGAATNQQFTAIITSLASSVKTAGELLGISGDDFTAKLNSFVVDIGKVSLKDLKGADLQKALESVFSKLGDDMAQFAVGGLAQFQQVGEGYLETLVRVAAEYQSIDVVFQSFGKTFGEVGLASIGARDRLVQLAGGLDKFTSQGEYFLTNFFSEKEQAAALKSRVQPVLDQYGLQASGEGAMRALRDFVVCLDTTTEAGAQAYTTLMQYAPAVKQIADAEKGVLDERKGLQDQVDQLTMTSIQLRMKERAGIDAANLSLYDYLQTLKDQATALQTTKDAAAAALGNVDNMFSVLQRVTKTTTDTLTARINAEKSLSDAVKSTLSSMKAQGSEASTRAAAQAQVQAALAIAKAGGPLPDAAAMQKSFSVLSQDASSMFATQADYLKDFYSTQNDIAALGDLADSSLSVDQKQLDSLNSMLAAAQQQIDLLKGIDVSGLTIAQALAGFKGAVSTAQANPIVGATPGIVDLYQSLLGRAPDQAGLQFWQESAAKGVSLDVMRQDFMKSDEYKHLHGVPGFASGGMFGGGLRLVGENGPELEATGPSRIWSSNQTAALLSRAGSGDNAALVTEIKALREEVKGLRSEARATATHSAKTANLLKRVIKNDTLDISTPKPIATTVTAG